MEELNDDELQDLLSGDSISGNNELSEKAVSDLLSYQDLFSTLKTAPQTGLPLSFASNVRRTLQERLNRKSDMRFNVMAVTIFVLSLALGYALLQLISQTTADLILNMVFKFKWLLFSIVCLFFCVLAIDQRLVRRDY
ncbi:hypothetical protein [Pedobacter sp. MR2016-24]|uniref:hypothetical protein n=1 Tax=Pedobacter sp. MR2016-24 TaxID=2994466 RepID=UPI002245CA99|nr:hypothetical protein [Pedobacter sp. MR2016-24]MCX2485055.1 hypothetical protein [Pedobacter sp. MR2016-24]